MSIDPKDQFKQVFHCQIHRSDRVIQKFSLGFRIQNRKKHETIPEEVLSMLTSGRMIFQSIFNSICT